MYYTFSIAYQTLHTLVMVSFNETQHTIMDEPVKSTETRQGWKHQKTTLLQQNHGKERLEEYMCCLKIVVKKG